MLRLTLFAVATFAAAAAFAQSSTSSITTNLSTMVVTAPTGTARPLDATLAPIIVLGSNQLAPFNGTDIASLLQFYAGLDVARNGGPGQPTSLFLRGAGSAETLVLVDGIRVNPGAIGGPPFANIRTSSAERVEIVEAPRSALYGSDAIGGVVNISLRRPRRAGITWGATISDGSYASHGASAHMSGGNGTLFGGATASWYETSGFPPLLSSQNTSAYRNQSIHAVIGARGKSSTAYASIWRSAGTSDYLDYAGAPRSEDYIDRISSLHLARQMSRRWHSRLLIGQFFDGIEQQQGNDFTHTWRNSLDWRNDIVLGTHHLLSAGAYFAHEHVNSLSYGTAYDTITTTTAAYLQDQMEYGSQSVVLAGRESHFSSFGTQFSWNADYGVRFAPSWRMTAGAGTGFRAPTATDRYGYGGNPALRPEFSHNLNAGIYRSLGNHALIGLDIYRNRIADLITFEATPTGGEEQNIGRATITGANLFARLRYGNWRIRPGLIIQRPLNDQTGALLPRRSRRSTTLDLTYDTGRWRAGMHLLATGPRKDSDFTNTTDAGYLLIDLTGAVTFAPHWRVMGRIENALDTKYQTAAGYRSPGRGLYLSLQYEMN